MSRIAVLPIVLLLSAGPAGAQDDQAATAPGGASTTVAQAPPKGEPTVRPTVATRSNVKIDLSISDHRGDAPPERKQVSMIVSETAWGKIRTHADTRPPSNVSGPSMTVALNVDARPFLTTSGHVQLELVVNYNPLDETDKVGLVRPTELNQSMTVVLQSGKPLIVAQAADPITDRRMIVEVVATILK
jgi:hypothetical protein